MTPLGPDDVSLDAAPAQRALQPAPRPQLTTAAMESFKCLVDRCPDTCCRDWAVPIDRADLEQMKAALAKHPNGRGKLVRLVVLGRPSSYSEAVASLQMDDGGGCPMLEADESCGVHATLGEAALTTACSVFPRTALAVGGHVEIGGSLGCPEVARLTLLGAQQPQLRPATAAMLPRDYVGKTIPSDPTDAYTHHFEDVRAALLDAFRGERPLGTALMIAADFAERVQPFFHAGTRDFDGARRPFTERRLGTELENTRSEELAAALDRDLAALRAPGAGVAALVWTLLSERQRLRHSPKYASLIQRVTTSVASERAGATDEVDHPELLWRVYHRRRDALAERLGSRSDRLFRNYCLHHLMRSPYTDAGTLLEALYRLAVHLCAVRLLVVLHPAVAERLSGAPDPVADGEVFERVAVEAVQTFTKAIAHHPDYLDAAVNQAASRAGGVTFGQLVLLAKFV